MQDSPALENVCTWKCTSNRPERRGDTGWQLWMRNTKPGSHGHYFLWLVTDFGAPLPLHNLCTFDLFLTQCNVRSIASPPFQFLYSPYHQQAEKYLEDLPDSCKHPPNLQGYCKDKMGNNPHEICLHLLGSHAYNATWTMPQKGQIPTANQKCEPSFYK